MSKLSAFGLKLPQVRVGGDFLTPEGGLPLPGELLDRLEQQRRGAVAEPAVEGKARLALTAGFARGGLQGQGVYPRGDEKARCFCAPVARRTAVSTSATAIAPSPQADPGQSPAAISVAQAGIEPERLVEVGQGQLEGIGKQIGPAAVVMKRGRVGA